MRKMRIRSVGATLAAVALMGSLAACGGGGGGESESGTSGDSGSSGALEGRGPFSYVQGKDNSGKMPELMDKWNEEHPDEQVTMIELSAEADAQRESMVNNAQTKSDAYCVLSLDNIHVPEFAARGWVDELPADEFEKSEFLDPVWQTGLYRDKLFAVPYASDGGILFVRTDILAEAGITDLPETWEDMISMWEQVKATDGYEDIAGYAGQFYKYEGFTVNIDEAINSGGGSILDDQGMPASNTPGAQEGVQRIVDGFESGFIPQEALTYKEEEGRAAFEAGRILFYRNWPYQYVLSADAIGEENFAVAPLPVIDGKPGVSSLGGHNLGISSFCQNKASALDFVKYLTSEEVGQELLTGQSLAPVRTALYEDQANIDAFPYLEILETSIENAVPRPRAVQYGDVSAAIQDSLYPTIDGTGTTPDAALGALDTALEPLVSTN